MPRQTQWQDNIINQGFATGAGVFESLVASFTAPDKRGMTLIRTLVRLQAFSNTVAGAYGVQRLNIGIGVASQEAFALGLTALSDPQTESNEPTRGWTYRTQVLVAQNGVSSPVLSDPVVADVRGMRKLENGELFLTMFNDNVVGTSFTVEVHGLIRCLFKLP